MSGGCTEGATKVKRWHQKAVDREEWVPVIKEAKLSDGRTAKGEWVSELSE
jgi:hypothetical protein